MSQWDGLPWIPERRNPKIWIENGAAWLPIGLDQLENLRGNSREALGWMLEDFLARVAEQVEADKP